MAEKTDRINCRICLNNFLKPKILECFHKFCESCLGDYCKKFSQDGEFPCPLCRRHIKIPEGGVKDFAPNVYIEDGQTISDAEVQRPLCDVCKNDVISKYRCEDCRQFLCQSCKSTHNSFSGCSNHKVINLEEIQITNDKQPSMICPEHHVKYSWYCLECSTVICCSTSIHRWHSTSEIDQLDESFSIHATSELKDMTLKLKETIHKLKQYISDLTGDISVIQRYSQEACNAVDKQVWDICAQFQQVGKEKKIEIEEMCNVRERTSSKKVKELIKMVHQLEEKSKTYFMSLENNSPVEILYHIPDATRCTTENSKLSFYLPGVSLPEFITEPVTCDTLTWLMGEIQMKPRRSFNLKIGANELKHGVELQSPWYTIARYACCISISSDVNNKLIVIIKDTKSDDYNAEGRKFSLKIINLKNDEKSIVKQIDTSRQVNRYGRYVDNPDVKRYKNGIISVTWVTGVDVKTLSDPTTGCTDFNSKFTVQLTAELTVS